MPIVDERLAIPKSIVIQTSHGQVFVSENFSIEPDQPMRGMVRIQDRGEKIETYWFNFDHIIWIGPR